VGKASFHLDPVVGCLAADLERSGKLGMNETPTYTVAVIFILCTCRLAACGRIMCKPSVFIALFLICGPASAAYDHALASARWSRGQRSVDHAFVKRLRVDLPCVRGCSPDKVRGTGPP